MTDSDMPEEAALHMMGLEVEEERLAATGRLERTEWTDPDTGYRCLAFLNHFRAWVGYVQVPTTHPMFGVPTMIPDDGPWSVMGFTTNPAAEPLNELEVHGGVTFAGVPVGCNEGTWWIGFDCNHGFDIAPGLERTLKAIMPPEQWQRHQEVFRQGPDELRPTFKDIEFVKRECARLAAQLKVGAHRDH